MLIPGHPESFDESQFGQPDRANALDFIVQQRALANEPYILNTKKFIRRLAIHELLSDRSSPSVIEFGCGEGLNLLTLARFLPGQSFVPGEFRLAGLDFDKTAINIAQARSLELKRKYSLIHRVFAPRLEFREWDITQPLPPEGNYSDNFYTVSIADRVLAHNADYPAIVENMVSATARDGLVILHEAQWLEGTYGLGDENGGGLTIASSLAGINTQIVDFFANSHRGADAANNIARLLTDNSLSEIQTGRGILRINDMDKAFYLAGIPAVTSKAVAAGVISEDQRQKWLKEQEIRAGEGKFLFRLPFILTYGWK